MIEKIKAFFKKIFGININSQNYLEAPKDNVLQIESQNKYNEFQEQIKFKSNPQEEKALKLQKDYKTGIIEEEDLSEEDFDILSNLYENQIKNTKESIENYRKKILNIKNKLVSTN